MINNVFGIELKFDQKKSKKIEYALCKWTALMFSTFRDQFETKYSCISSPDSKTQLKHTHPDIKKRALLTQLSFDCYLYNQHSETDNQHSEIRLPVLVRRGSRHSSLIRVTLFTRFSDTCAGWSTPFTSSSSSIRLNLHTLKEIWWSIS